MLFCIDLDQSLIEFGLPYTIHFTCSSYLWRVRLFFLSFLFLLLCYKKHCLSLPCTCLLLHFWDWFSKGSNVDCRICTFTILLRLSFFLNMHLENQCKPDHISEILSLMYIILHVLKWDECTFF